jgi:hypothetical protein
VLTSCLRIYILWSIGNPMAELTLRLNPHFISDFNSHKRTKNLGSVYTELNFTPKVTRTITPAPPLP